MMKQIVFIATSFPSKEFPYHGTFNFKAVKQLQEHLSVLVIHLRSNNFKRPIIKRRIYEGIEVIELSIFYFNSFSNWFTAFNIGLYKIIAYRLLKKFITKDTILHSVGLVLSAQVGAYISKKMKIKHIAQGIGSDINVILPALKDYKGVKNWEHYTNIIVCNSYALEKNIRNLYPDIKSKVVYRGVDLEQYPYTELKIENKIRFLFLGGLSIIKTKVLFNRKHPIKIFDKIGEDFKGGVLLLKAWKKWMNENKITDVELFYGGPNTSIEKINRIIQQNLNDLNIKFLGPLKKNEVIENIKKTNVIIVPSYAEGLPNVAMEAFSIGRPVIGSNVGGIPELVEHKKTGYLFPPGNTDELVKALEFFCTNKEKINIFGAQARKKVETEFNASNFIKSYLKIYYED